MSSRSSPSVLATHWPTLLIVALAVAVSSVTMVLAAGGGVRDATVVGGVGLVVGGVTAGYIYHLLLGLRRT